MVICSKCNKELKKPTYLVRQLGYLCGECARKHANREIEKLNKQIIKLNCEVYQVNQQVKQAIQNDCEHEFEDTGYGRRGLDGELEAMAMCKKCDIIKYIKF